MDVNKVSSTTATYQSSSYQATEKAQETAASTSTTKESGVVYEKSGIQSMSKEDRAALVQQLKDDQQARKTQFTDLVMNMMNKQGAAIGQADDIWKFLAKGDFTVDAKTKQDAQAAIADDGYWGVEQTSQRIFDFAMALSGGDVDKMKEMQAAFEKGFKAATKSWGQELPDISHRTRDAVNAKFENYFNPQDAA